ncbi:hypothetical protein BT96DRAFT_1058816 [Gymnopus androsaceus JB14]|uniref:Uncharacterized protein n=1 Tax=Gymnopus androsaceus JB14 TaxID=1447944 RepID=A0A6A4H2K1_9AGAR|nr:hypothetical protein BT96DRAFT_1058816 [Gymnopus androsaceus JB14]
MPKIRQQHPEAIPNKSYKISCTQLQSVEKHASALKLLEEARAKAQYAFEDAEEDLQEEYGKAGATLEKLVQNFSPPATPSKPQRSRGGNSTVVVVVPGGQVDLSKIVITGTSPTKAAHQSPAPRSFYIVYHGRDGGQGLFDSWKGREGHDGPDSLCDGYEHRLNRKFSSLKQAQTFYQECLDSGVLDLLRGPPTESEVFIIVKGGEPGVYTKRLTLLIDGLAWRGGVVMVGTGTRRQAEVQFRQWQTAGQTEVLCANGPARDF